MNEVRPGDVIFSYVGGKIVSVAVAKTAAYDSPRPSDLGEGVWEDAGKKVEVEYLDLSVPLVIAGVVPELQPLLPERYSPLTRFGTGNQGYLFALPPRVGRFLLERIGVEQSDFMTDPVVEGISRVVKDATERRALVMSRIGQGQFREALMVFWGLVVPSPVWTSPHSCEPRTSSLGGTPITRRGSTPSTGCCCPRPTTRRSTPGSSRSPTKAWSSCLPGCRRHGSIAWG